MILNPKREPQSGDSALISLWVSERMPAIIEAMENGLRAAGFEVSTKSEGGEPRIYMHISFNGERRGAIDVTKTMVDIATINRTSYDRRLTNPVYEATKTRLAIGERIATAKVVFSKESGNVMGDLVELSKRHGIRFIVMDKD